MEREGNVFCLFWDVLGGFWGRKHQKKVLVGRKQLLSLDSVCSCLSQVIHLLQGWHLLHKVSFIYIYM